MPIADIAGAGEAGEPNQPKHNSVIFEIRSRWAKLDRVDEVVLAVKSMLISVRGMVQAW
jgi:hypothetical protein